MYATVMSTKPSTNAAIVCGRLSRDSGSTLMPIQRAPATLPITHATSSAHNTNGTTAMPMTETASKHADGADQQQDEQADAECRERTADQHIGHLAHWFLEDEIQEQVDEKEDDDGGPDPPELRNDRPSPEQPARDPGKHAFKAAAERVVVDHDMAAICGKIGWRVELAADDDEVAVKMRAFRHIRVGIDQNQRALDVRGAGNFGVPEHNHRIV